MNLGVFEGLPSGKSYGTPTNWTYVDDRDFVIVFFVNEVGGDKPDYTWVVEHKDGREVLIKHDAPFHYPVFGLDEQEWYKFKHDMLPVIDEFIKTLS